MRAEEKDRRFGSPKVPMTARIAIVVLHAPAQASTKGYTSQRAPWFNMIHIGKYLVHMRIIAGPLGVQTRSKLSNRG